MSVQAIVYSLLLLFIHPRSHVQTNSLVETVCTTVSVDLSLVQQSSTTAVCYDYSCSVDSNGGSDCWLCDGPGHNAQAFTKLEGFVGNFRWWVILYIVFLLPKRNIRQGAKICLHELFNPFTPESDQCQISPAASQEILHHTVRRTWLFIAYSDERWF